MFVQEFKTTYYLFEVIVQPHKISKSYVIRFEAILRTIVDSEQHLVLTAFKRNLGRALRPLRDHHVISYLVPDSIWTYEDAKVLIFYHIHIEKTRRLCSLASE